MAKQNILIVDDSQMMRNIIKGFLAEFDCDTMEASYGC